MYPNQVWAVSESVLIWWVWITAVIQKLDPRLQESSDYWIIIGHYSDTLDHCTWSKYWTFRLVFGTQYSSPCRIGLNTRLSLVFGSMSKLWTIWLQNSRPHDLNTGLVWYSDCDCTLLGFFFGTIDKTDRQY